MKRSLIVTAAALALSGLITPIHSTLAADAPAVQKFDASRSAQAALEKATAYLQSQQKEDGSWQTGTQPPALTALALRGMLADGKRTADDPAIKKGFDKLLSFQLDNGGIFKDTLSTYNTAIAVTALTAAHDDRYKSQIDKAVGYLKSLQWTDTVQGLPSNVTKIDEKNPNYGGWGYSAKKGRADGSNLQTAIQALHDSGLPETDPAYKNAQKFLSRMQNLSETNDQPWATNDGGFVYTPGNNGESMAGEYVDASGRKLLRSYGSMTYAGLKSMIYCGLKKDDPRVKAAWDWIRKNYTVDANPGMSGNGAEHEADGLYYYYLTMARALSAYGEPVITDAQGHQHDWRQELIAKLVSLQQADGSWKGQDRFMESNPIIATSYAAIALQEAAADLKEHPAK